MARLPGLAVTAAVVVCVALAGCTATPSGVPRKVSEASSQLQAYGLPEPPPPPTAASHWTVQAVVTGFLHASASYFIDPSAAKAYLAPNLRKRWHPGAVTIVGGHPSVHELNSRNAPDEPPTKTVTFTGQKLATLSQSGQYLYASGTPKYKFELRLYNGVWLIEELPQLLPPGSQALLLLQSDFEAVYQPRNLYFFAPKQPDAPLPDLVPDPVYAPVEGSDTALNTIVATALVRGLFKDNNSWLSGGATSTAFRRGTTLKHLLITGQTAVVNLGGAAAGASAQQRQEMYEQLMATLTTASAYSPPVARHVKLEIDGKSKYLSSYSDLIPPVSSEPEPAFVQKSSSSVTELLPHKRPRPVLGPSQVDGDTITAIAAQPASASPGSQLAAAVRAGNGCAIYVGTTGARAYHRYRLSTAGGPCTSLSWDRAGRLWAATARGIWALQPGSHAGAARRVSLPDIPGTGDADYKILALRMAPDAVRAALLIQPTPAKTKTGRSQPAARSVLLAAVRTVRNSKGLKFGTAVTAGTGLPDLRAISWYNAYYLAALAGNSVIYRVPLTGGASSELGSAPLQAQTLTTGNSELVVGTSRVGTGQPQIFKSPASALSWTPLADGTNPTYPG